MSFYDQIGCIGSAALNSIIVYDLFLYLRSRRTKLQFRNIQLYEGLYVVLRMDGDR